MKIYSRKHRQEGIPLVPMLDILTILLIFFIVHTELKHRVNVINLELPRTYHLAGQQDKADALLLELRPDGSIVLDGKAVGAAELPEAVRLLRRANPEASVQFAASEAAAMGRFVEVLDCLTSAGLRVEQVPVRIDYRGKQP
ncbi:MAG: biopolymer transporter ExbD [Akkermansia muciniphila]|nr:biopolymer transporter ExbD [Akkermansia muciniphila]